MGDAPLLLQPQGYGNPLESMMSTTVNTDERIAANPAPPSSLEVGMIVIDGVRYRQHQLGGGLVAVTAYVAPGVRVAPQAIVRGHAVVVGAVRLFGRVVVEENAVVTGSCTLRDDASVGGDAIVRGSVTLADHARADGYVRLGGSVKLRHFAHVSAGIITGGMTIT